MMNNLVLSIDAMGGDHAPDIVIEGVDAVARARPGVRFRLHGRPSAIEPLLERFPDARAASEVCASESVVGMDMKPTQALRQGRGSSLWNAIEAVKSGDADAVVSAGNTGAYMAMALIQLRAMPGVHRPALTANWPSLREICTVLDVGANVVADAAQLVEFAIMGEAFHRAIHGKANPTVGLLNVGAEDQKGHEEIRAAARIIRESNLGIDFHGFVEGDDIAKGTVDVVVTDGFTGNIALKTAEGTARMVASFLKDALTDGLLAKAGAVLAYPSLKNLRARMDPSSVNGAVFLGLNGVVVKSHGGASGPGFAAAIDVAARLARSSFREEIARNIARVEDNAEAPASVGEGS